MNSIKSILIAALLSVAAFATITYTACKKDPCKDVTCVNGGTCEDGVCKCPTGFEGARCETKTDPCKFMDCMNGGTCSDGKCSCPTGYEGEKCEKLARDKFFGIWSGTSNCTSNTFSTTLTAGNSPTEIVLIEPGVLLTGNLTDNNTVTFQNK